MHIGYKPQLKIPFNSSISFHFIKNIKTLKNLNILIFYTSKQNSQNIKKIWVGCVIREKVINACPGGTDTTYHRMLTVLALVVWPSVRLTKLTWLAWHNIRAGFQEFHHNSLSWSADVSEKQNHSYFTSLDITGRLIHTRIPKKKQKKVGFQPGNYSLKELLGQFITDNYP